MNCEPEIITRNIQSGFGEKEIGLRCVTHGFIYANRDDPFYPEQVICVLLKKWGEHVLEHAEMLFPVKLL